MSRKVSTTYPMGAQGTYYQYAHLREANDECWLCDGNTHDVVRFHLPMDGEWYPAALSLCLDHYQDIDDAFWGLSKTRPSMAT